MKRDYSIFARDYVLDHKEELERGEIDKETACNIILNEYDILSGYVKHIVWELYRDMLFYEYTDTDGFNTVDIIDRILYIVVNEFDYEDIETYLDPEKAQNEIYSEEYLNIMNHKYKNKIPEKIIVPDEYKLKNIDYPSIRKFLEKYTKSDKIKEYARKAEVL